jgi:hypothetical protein
MKRAASIEALLKKANADFVELKKAYESSLEHKHVSEDFKVSIKNIFENLRSCLDYLAQDIFERHCASSKKPDRLYFPIRPTSPEFVAAVAKDYPGLQTMSKAVFDILDAVQPYHDPWLGSFNKLSNHNKHQDLVEQARTETRQVTVSRGGGSVSWGSGVTFGGGVSVMGVPIDPRTQMPVPNNIARTEVVTRGNFLFKEINQSVLPFLELSLKNVEDLFGKLKAHV